MDKTNAPPLPLFDTLEQIKQSAKIIPVPSRHSTEFELALQFLLSYRGSTATFNAYRRDIERLLQWAWWIKKKSILRLKRSDIENYIEFCQQPPSTWVADQQRRRFIIRQGLRVPNPDWRPFTQKMDSNNNSHRLSSPALQAVFAILSSFYNYLIQEDVMAYNPVAQIRQKSRFIRKQQTQVVRRLSELQWSYVVDATKKLVHEDPSHERSLFIIQALYGMYLRISELACSSRWQPQMGDFFQDGDHNWWFKTVGKGNKERMISVSDAMLGALKRYRLYLGLSPLPSHGESTPLIQQLNHSKPLTSTRQIRNIVQQCFQRAIDELTRDGLSDEIEALQQATVHWLRHTGISDDVKIRPREHVRDDAGHGSSSITDRYIDVELRERHASAKNKPLDPLDN
jgi:site-specific recombinase XerD